MDSSTFLVAAGVAIAVMGVIWFGLRFWLASTRPADIKDIDTPALDRLNREALEGTFSSDEEDDDEEEAPQGLKDAAPDTLK